MRSSRPKILVTGGTGFIGSYVVAALQELYTPVVLDRYRRRSSSDVVLGDVRDPVAVDAAVADCYGIIHLAGVLGTQETIDLARAPAETNIIGTLNVLSAARRHDRRMVYISVGNWWMENPYSITKHTAERFCRMYRQEFGTKVSVVRALNAYGPRQKSEPVRKIIPTFINSALRGHPLKVYGSGEQVMDMIYVSDVARVLVAALEQTPEVIVEAGTGRPTTVNEIAQKVIAEVGEGEIEHVEMRPGEEPDATVLADASTLAALGISAKDFISLEDGLEDTVAWFRSYTSSGALAA